jgi:enoyl-CoA hydratase/carnithine racemase
VGAEEAKAIGLVTEVAPDAAALEAAVAESAAALAAKSPLAVQGTKQAMLHARDHSVGDGLEFVAMMNSARLTSEDLSEAMGAKFARRAPTFSKL